MGYRHDLWELAASRNGVVTITEAEDAGVPAVEVRKLVARGALLGYGQGVYTHREVPTTPFTEPAVAVALGGKGPSCTVRRCSIWPGLGSLIRRKCA